jgi:hypothetical protein
LGHLGQHVHGLDPVRALDDQKQVEGNFIKLLKEYNNLCERQAQDKNNRLLDLLIAEKNTEILAQKDRMWDVDRHNTLNLSCEDDVFLEALVSNIKGQVVSFQSWVKKVENKEKNLIISRLNMLKVDFDINSSEICRLEEELKALLDKETLLKVKSMKLFSCLNNERPTPLFLSLARASSKGTNLSAVCKKDGSPYLTEEDKVEGIVSYYEDIYRKPITDQACYSGCIEKFLGLDIVSSPIVVNSNLTDTEKTTLDSPLTIDELDNSLNKCNIRSAPGIDGLSNAFIIKYWQFLRMPLFKYANCCFTKGVLTPNFRAAAIKLIPKKGDCSDIKNWRPISLLSNLYKIISRAINNRLNTIVNRICSRAQKGFNNKRYTQECLINVIETIAHCNTTDIGGAAVAVDMAKAFDTLSHGFLREVFRFFNMGPVLIDWLTLLGENRTACILLDNGSYSRNFRLGRGRAQGDNISPNTFNFADQILIFKIELDPNIHGVWKNFQIPPMVSTNSDSFFMYESRGETSKNESLADDNTTLLLLDEGNLRTLRHTLDEFGKISGLLCNYDKTVVMPIRKKKTIPTEMSGFVLADNIKLLGMNITANLSNVDDIFIDIGEKILGLILFWSRFRLSLPGRIAILKTLLIPQLNYLGCILTPSQLVIKNIQEMVDDFVIGGIRVNKSRYYIPTSEGGLGLIHVGTFLMAQKCSWIKRIHSNIIDNWRLHMVLKCPDYDITLLRKIDVDYVDNPILYGIAEAYELFVNCFSRIGTNYKVIPIFNNSLYCRSKSDSGLLDINFFGKNFYNEYRTPIRKLRYVDCFVNGIFKDILQFQAEGMTFPVSTWMKLRSAILLAKKNFAEVETGSDPPPDPQSINTFLTRFKKGSKPFRKINDLSTYQGQSVTDLPVLKSFSDICHVNVPNATIAKNFFSSWNCIFLENSFCEFIFKLRNNLIKTGDRLSNFLPNYDDSCSLCRNLLNNMDRRETFLNFFRKCPVTDSLILRFNKRLRLTWNVTDLNFEQLYWFGDMNNMLDRPTLLVYDIFRYQLWCMKQRKIIDLEFIINNSIDTLRTIFSIKPAIKSAFLKHNGLANILQATG